VLLYELVNCEEIKNAQSSTSDTLATINHSYPDIFASICTLVDKGSSKLTRNYSQFMSLVKQITQEILKNGVTVFFPSENIRKKVFMQLIENNIEEAKVVTLSQSSSSLTSCPMSTNFSFNFLSTQLLFEAFCNLYCINKSLLLKHLINDSVNMFESWDRCNEAICFVDKLIKFSFFLNDSLNSTNVTKSSQNDTNKLINAVNDLLNSIQSSIFFTIQSQLIKLETLKSAANGATEISKIETNIQNFLINYTNLIYEKSNFVINKIQEKRKTAECLTQQQVPIGSKLHSPIANLIECLKLKNFLNKTVYNFVLWLSELFDKIDLNSCTTINETLVNLHNLITQIEKYVDDEKVINLKY
jgi:hypothetical protein